MRAACSAAAVLLAACTVVASPITGSHINGIIYPTVEGRDAYALGLRAVCNADNVLRDLRDPRVSASASAFCSAYLQSTSTVTATTVIAQTSTVPVTDIVTVTSTATEVDVIATTTVLCPASATATLTTCNYPAYGFNSYLISSNPNIDPYTCHQLCLSDPNCQSFQVQAGGAQYCNLYNKPTAGYTFYAPSDVYTFYDRDCPQYTAGACGNTAAKIKRDPAPALPNPSYIPATVPPARVSSACSCFIASPSPPATQTVVVSQTSVTDVTTTILVTDTVVLTTTVDTTATAAITAPP